MNILPSHFSRKLLAFGIVEFAVLFGLVWFIAGNDHLFKSTVPIEQRLVSSNESIRKKAQQELLGLSTDKKRDVAERLIPGLEQQDAFTRKWAFIALALLGPDAQEAIPALLQAVSSKEKDVSQAAKVALSEIGAPDAEQLPSLLRTLDDSRLGVRCEAALSIGKMGPASAPAAPVLTGYLLKDMDPPACFETALAELLMSAPEGADASKDVLTPVLNLLRSSRTEVRRRAAEVLSQMAVRSEKMARPLLETLASEPDPDTRVPLMKALAMPVTREEGPRLIWAHALRSSRLDLVRLSALNRLRTLDLPADALRGLWAVGLRDSNDTVRQGAAQWIRENTPHGRETLPLVIKMLKDKLPAIRRLGLETLRRSGARSSDILRQVAKAQRDIDPGVRCRAAETLVESGSPDRVSISLLIEDLRKDDDTARCAEDALGLAAVFDADVVHSMIRLVQDDRNPDVRSRAARVLMHLGPRARDAIPALVHAQRDEVPGAKMALKAIRSSGFRRRN